MTTDTAPWSWSTAVENVTIGAASATNRRDVVVAYIDLSVTNPSTSTPNNPGALKFKAVQGTPASSPSDPSDPTIQSSVGAGNPWVALARVSLTSSTTQITNAQITSLIKPMALQNVRLWGGGSNTQGHQIPNIADAFLALTSRSDGKVDFASLLSTIFSGQVQSQANAGSAGGTIYYVNLGGIKLAWGLTANQTIGGAAPASAPVGITFPTGFFSTIQSALAFPGPTGGTQYASFSTASISASAWSINFNITVGSAGVFGAYWFVIGT
jgi:hypothetical protein